MGRVRFPLHIFAPSHNIPAQLEPMIISVNSTGLIIIAGALSYTPNWAPSSILHPNPVESNILISWMDWEEAYIIPSSAEDRCRPLPLYSWVSVLLMNPAAGQHYAVGCLCCVGCTIYTLFRNLLASVPTIAK